MLVCVVSEEVCTGGAVLFSRPIKPTSGITNTNAAKMRTILNRSFIITFPFLIKQ